MAEAWMWKRLIGAGTRTARFLLAETFHLIK
jgi:hypothetical protein